MMGTTNPRIRRLPVSATKYHLSGLLPMMGTTNSRIRRLSVNAYKTPAQLVEERLQILPDDPPTAQATKDHLSGLLHELNYIHGKDRMDLLWILESISLNAYLAFIILFPL